MIFEIVKRCIFCIGVIISLHENSNVVSNVENNNESFYMEKEIMTLSIPKIGVFNKIYDFNSTLNNIDKNVEIMLYSDLPDKTDGNVILGGHSGSGSYAYFKNFDMLAVGDDIFLEMNNSSYHYKIINIYTDYKDGSISVSADNHGSMITLFTCDPNNKNNYLVIIGKLI